MVIAVDFDGTIVQHEYPLIGKEIPFATDVLKRLQSEGDHQLILWTVREGVLLQEAIDWCKQRGLTFYAINQNHPGENLNDKNYSRKIVADLYIDDRNFGMETPNWTKIYQSICGISNLTDDNDQLFLVESEANIFVRFGRWIERMKREIKKHK